VKQTRRERKQQRLSQEAARANRRWLGDRYLARIGYWTQRLVKLELNRQERKRQARREQTLMVRYTVEEAAKQLRASRYFSPSV
jgi:hypothetical protein